MMTQIGPGHLLGRYELLAPIAKGGMAQVWAARLKGSRGFHKFVAVKTVLPRALDDEKMERMFLEEASLASQIHHPNVVATLELGEQDGVLYLVMEWVEGEPLGEVIARARESGGLPLGVAVNLIGQALKGLSAAHTARDENGAALGLVHRDISPQNVLITYAGMAKLVDFGIAKATSRTSGLTELGEIKGKFSYMSPEQVRGELVGPSTDVFAMGILLYVVTTGRHPFKGDTPAETISRICNPALPPMPSSFVEGYPPDVEAVLAKALAKTVAERYSSAQEMLVALERALPQAFELSAEIRVAEYVKNLLAEKATQRRATLRLAREFIERTRGDASSSSSTFSSLRGISIEQTPSSASAPTPSISAPISSTPRPERVPSSTISSVGAPRAQRRWPVMIGALAVLTVAGAAVVRVAAPHMMSAAGHAAAAVSAPEPAPKALAPAETAPRDPGATNSDARKDAAANDERDSQDDSKQDKAIAGQPGKAKRYGRRIVPGAARTPVTASTPLAKEASESAPAPSRPSAPKESSAWDPGAFGGRQ